MPTLRHIAVYLGLALVLTLLHGENVNWSERQHKRLDRHAQILRGTGDAPWGYRIAVPFTAEALRRAQGGQALPEKLPKPKTPASKALSDPLERGYLLLRFLFTAGLFVAFHGWLARFGTATEAFAGTAFLAALHGPSYAHYWFQPASSLDLMLWVAAALALHHRRDPWVPALLLVGAVNRETSVFLVALYAVMRFETLSWGALAARCGGLLAIWAAVQGAIRAWIGPLGWAGRGATPADYLADNLSHPDWLLYAAAFFGVLWVVPGLVWRRLPTELKGLVLVLVPYVALQFLFGRVREVRLFLPLAIALVPAALIWLRPPER